MTYYNTWQRQSGSNCAYVSSGFSGMASKHRIPITSKSNTQLLLMAANLMRQRYLHMRQLHMYCQHVASIALAYSQRLLLDALPWLPPTRFQPMATCMIATCPSV